MSPRTNGDLKHALDLAVAAWEQCSAVVDLVVSCQARVLDTHKADTQ